MPDDGGRGAATTREESPGVPGEEGTGTGNPDAAGSDESEPSAGRLRVPSDA